MSGVPLGPLRAVAARLDPLRVPYCFVGGAIATLLVDRPELSPVRQTDDIDVIIEVVTEHAIAPLEQRLRDAGFAHDSSGGSPSCRWLLGDRLTVDIMPTRAGRHGLNTTWFPEALAAAISVSFGGSTFRVVSPVGFLATKYVAFCDRGNGDFFASHDVEDFVAIIDGRAGIADEVKRAAEPLRSVVVSAIRQWLNVGDFIESLSGHLPADIASQGRLAGLRAKLQAIAARQTVHARE